MSVFSGAERCFHYVVHDPPRPREFFDAIVQKSYALDSTFMKCLRISRVFDGFSLDLIDRDVYRHEGGITTVDHLENMGELKAVVQNQLGMPRCPIEAAVGVLERLTRKPFFAGVEERRIPG